MLLHRDGAVRCAPSEQVIVPIFGQAFFKYIENHVNASKQFQR